MYGSQRAAVQARLARDWPGLGRDPGSPAGRTQTRRTWSILTRPPTKPGLPCPLTESLVCDSLGLWAAALAQLVRRDEAASAWLSWNLQLGVMPRCIQSASAEPPSSPTTCPRCRPREQPLLHPNWVECSELNEDSELQSDRDTLPGTKPLHQKLLHPDPQSLGAGSLMT